MYKEDLLYGTGLALYHYFMNVDDRKKVWANWSIANITLVDQSVVFTLKAYHEKTNELQEPSTYPISADDRHYVFMKGIGNRFRRLSSVPYAQLRHEFTVLEADARAIPLGGH